MDIQIANDLAGMDYNYDAHRAEVQTRHHEPRTSHFLMYVNVLDAGEYVQKVAVMERWPGVRVGLYDSLEACGREWPQLVEVVR